MLLRDVEVFESLDSIKALGLLDTNLQIESPGIEFMVASVSD